MFAVLAKIVINICYPSLASKENARRFEVQLKTTGKIILTHMRLLDQTQFNFNNYTTEGGIS